MSGRLRRGLADLACRVLQVTLPPSLQSWGWAVRCETAEIPDDTEALLFALESLCGLMPHAIGARLLRPCASPTGDGALHSGGTITMTVYDATMRRPRALGTICAIGAVALGLAYLLIAGAPVRYLAVNASALVIGLAMLALLGRAEAAARQGTGGAISAMAGALLATALLGDEVEGAARWVHLAGVSLQPSLILLPVMLVGFSRSRNALATAGIVASVLAMALQPDRAMAGMLALALIVLAIMRRERQVIAAAAVSAAGFAITLARPDTLSAVPFVDEVLYSSFDVHAAAGIAVLGGAALLLVPALAGWNRDPANRATYVTFGAVWFAAVMAAALGNYPTPIVGYGGSAIIGYALSLLALPKRAEARAAAASATRSEAEATPTDRHLLVGTA
ncbi:hypothetical protein [Allosphingosinicella deserti]|uniref:hypothetical protein n=1 Tax=Allosphingosinicella deserti TaxID=2116704 RepID=UPI001E3B641E|nr:hypothetical protein [Sphingomonas deserti]